MMTIGGATVLHETLIHDNNFFDIVPRNYHNFCFDGLEAKFKYKIYVLGVKGFDGVEAEVRW